jgi:hypothetical protein
MSAYAAFSLSQSSRACWPFAWFLLVVERPIAVTAKAKIDIRLRECFTTVCVGALASIFHEHALNGS